MKRLDVQYEEKKRAIFKTCMARGRDNFSWEEYWRRINELRKEMWPLFTGSGICPPWSAKAEANCAAKPRE